jgi:aspartyl-tRNA(Asn)/glutamyl-tRNA(Gln) amidotransferase subunit A
VTLAADPLDNLYRPALDFLQAVDPGSLWDVEPGFSFDPVAAAGGEAPLTPWDDGPQAPAPDVPAGEPEGDLTALSVAELASLIRRGRVSPGQVAAAHLERIAALDGRINAFLLRLDPPAAELPEGPVRGVPFGLKDIIETAGVRTTGGSRQRLDYVPERDADVAARIRSAGGVLLGKLNTHEFAAGATGDNVHFGPARNPWNLERLCGGSSSGSAAAVAARMLPFAVGTDTGGSIRIPAACCGVVGLKPTYDLVSRRGVFPLSWTLDHVGPICRTVRDAGLLLRVMAASPRADYEAAAAPADLRGLRVGVLRPWVEDGVQPGVRAAFEAALDALRGLGCSVRDVEVPPAGEMALANRAVALPEAAAWHLPYLRTSPERYSPDVRARKEAGLRFRGVDYLNAQRIRTQYCRQFHRLWERAEVLVSPTLPIVAPPVGSPPQVNADLIRLTAPVNLLGCPAISVPAGFGEEGLPVGLQIVAPPFRLRVAASFEAATGWTRRAPALAA